MQVASIPCSTCSEVQLPATDAAAAPAPPPPAPARASTEVKELSSTPEVDAEEEATLERL